MAGQRLAGSGNMAASPVTVAGVGGPATTRQSVRQAVRTTKVVSGSLAKGMGGFFRPFRRVGGIVFLEVTGVFFFLFVMVFANWAWKLRANYAQGPDHTRFLVYAAMTLVFLYLTVSSFWRARRK
jgi:hypothetical protein